jgi:fumarylacetoacetase
MTVEIDETHDPSRRSFVDAANQPDVEFPIQNLPLGVFSTADDPTPRIGMAIGDHVFDLKKASAGSERFADAARAALQEPALNSLFSLGRSALRELRRIAADMLDEGSSDNSVRRL